MKDQTFKKTAVQALTIAGVSIALSSMSRAMKPKTVTLDINEDHITIQTKAKNVSELLDNIGYVLAKDSKMNTTLDAEVKDKMLIEIDTKKNVVLSNGGKNTKVTTFASTVEELLKEENIKVDADDVIRPGKDSKLSDGEKVVVDYMTITETVKTEKIKFDTKVEKSFDLAYGKSITSVEGKDGIKEVVFRKVVKNGNVVSNGKASEKIVKEPVTKVLVQGTKQVVTEKIKNEVEKRNNSKLYVGQTKVIQAGNQGEKRVVYKNDGKTKVKVEEKITKKATKRIVEVGTKKRPAIASTGARYTLSQFMSKGVIRWGGYKFTYYSQRVLPGGGLRIPGRHVNAAGYVADKDGYIVLANSAPKGTVIRTPFGYMGKVYDRGTAGNHFDVYIR